MNPEDLLTVPLSPALQAEANYPDIEEIQRLYGEGLVKTPAGERGNFFSLDPFGLFRTRQKSIKEAAGKYKPGQGFELDSNSWGLGITQQDVANYYMTKYQQERNLDPEVRDARKLFPEGQKPNAATSQIQLEKKVGQIKQNRALTSQIKALDGGPARLAAAVKKKGSNLNNGELESLLSIATNNTREAESGREATSASIKNLQQQTESSKATDKINQGTLDVSKGNLALNQTIARNAQIQAENASKTDAYRYEDTKYERGLDRQYDADREDARFAANLETVRLQNAAEMERYNMMLQNDRDVRRGSKISELMQALTVLGGSFAL